MNIGFDCTSKFQSSNCRVGVVRIGRNFWHDISDVRGDFIGVYRRKIKIDCSGWPGMAQYLRNLHCLASTFFSITVQHADWENCQLAIHFCNNCSHLRGVCLVFCHWVSGQRRRYPKKCNPGICWVLRKYRIYGARYCNRCIRARSCGTGGSYLLFWKCHAFHHSAADDGDCL